VSFRLDLCLVDDSGTLMTSAGVRVEREAEQYYNIWQFLLHQHIPRFDMIC